MISYQPLWETLKRKGLTKYRLCKYYNVSESTLHRIQKGAAISTNTLDDLCGILKCRVEDIILFVDTSGD